MIDISVGKYTLESLTTGMYISPKVIFREYIQNAIDSIDEAAEQGVMTRDEGHIIIELDRSHKRILIEDNGLGISVVEVSRNLLDIGNSKKLLHKRNGFRGIGRLVGLSYSKRLIFKTSYPGEKFSTEICFNGTKLNELLRPGENDNYDIKSVIGAITKVKKKYEKLDEHYFKVILEGVENVDGILEKDAVIDYISQVAPVPYNSNKFSHVEAIHNYFKENNLLLEEYKIYIKDTDEKVEQVFKQYQDNFLTDKQRKIWDSIKDIRIERIYNSKANLTAIVWYNKSNLLGTILNEDIKGLRLRKGNILIGDKTTLNHIFKEDRFNGWFLGEVFVIDNSIIPNARRDNFERTKSYQELLDILIELGSNLSKIIRDTSTQRNREKLAKSRGTLNVQFSYEDIQEDTKENIIFSSTSKSQEIYREFQLLKASGSENYHTKYELLNASSKITVPEKKILEKTFDVLKDECDEAHAERIIVSIVAKLNL